MRDFGCACPFMTLGARARSEAPVATSFALEGSRSEGLAGPLCCPRLMFVIGTEWRRDRFAGDEPRARL